MTEWTDEEDALLRREWPAGKSATEIARMLRGRTRNAVIGRVSRLKIMADTRQAPPPPRAQRQPPKPGPKNKPGAVFGYMPATNAAEAQERREKATEVGVAKVRAFNAPANDASILLIDRRRSQCAWPLGNPSRPALQMCCGAQVPEGQPASRESYCPEHGPRAVVRTVDPTKYTAKGLIRSLRKVAA